MEDFNQEEADRLVIEGKWDKILEIATEEMGLTVSYIEKEGGLKRIEIKDLEGNIVHTTNSTGPEDDFMGIAGATAQMLLNPPDLRLAMVKSKTKRQKKIRKLNKKHNKKSQKR